MSDKNLRRPIRTFFIKRSIQFKIITSIFMTVFFTGIITTSILAYIYNIKSHQGSFYFMSNNIMEDLELTSIVGVILPPLIIAQTIMVVVALGIGLFSSRLVAVPIYKIERWASRLKNGKLRTTLDFREKNMKELSIQCNAVTDSFKRTLSEIHEHTEILEQQSRNLPPVREEVRKIKCVLDKLEF